MPANLAESSAPLRPGLTRFAPVRVQVCPAVAATRDAPGRHERVNPTGQEWSRLVTSHRSSGLDHSGSPDRIGSPLTGPERLCLVRSVMHTVAEVAALLRVSDPTVRRLIRSGQLAAIKNEGGRAVRIPDEALNAYLATQWTPVAPRQPEEAATP